jgi:hypothetical protein
VKLVLFDLGDTLEHDGVLLPGARDTLNAISSLRSDNRPAALMGLISDFDMPDKPSDVPTIQRRYYRLLDDLDIRQFFEPVAKRVTLSTEVGVRKPDEAIFKVAIGNAGAGLRFDDVLFITENPDHVLAARRLGLGALHVQGPGQQQGEVGTLPELVPLVLEFVRNEEPDVTAVLDLPLGANGTARQRFTEPEVEWTRLGNVLVVRAAATRVAAVLAPEGLAGSAGRRFFVPKRRLHLVTQLGRLFQEDHPDIRVLVDKGRYLVVDVDPERSLAGAHASCYAARPLPVDTVVFDQFAAGPVSLDAVDLPADMLSRQAFEEDVRTLTRWRTRRSTSADFLDALEWAKTQLSALGFATTIQSVEVGGGTTRNLIGDLPGDGDERKLVVITAHLDSVNRHGADGVAPGADDNASGSAGVVAIGRALAGRPRRNDLRLILFGGEEQGLFGSRHYVSGLEPDERSRISAVVNMDMIAARNGIDPCVLLEGAEPSQQIINALAGIARMHTSLAVQTSLQPFNSDHVPFLDLDIPAVLTIEGTDSANDRVHTERDTPDTLDFDLALQILRMNILFAEQALADASLSPGPLHEGRSR